MGILLNMVILLLSQVLLACEAMVTYLSPFVRGLIIFYLIVRKLFCKYKEKINTCKFHSEIIFESVRNINYVSLSINASAVISIMLHNIFWQKYHLTDIEIERFMQNWQRFKGKGRYGISEI